MASKGRNIQEDLYIFPRRFHLRFWDNKEIWATFKDKAAGITYGNSMYFLRSWMELYDSRDKKVVYSFSGGNK